MPSDAGERLVSRTRSIRIAKLDENMLYLGLETQTSELKFITINKKRSKKARTYKR